MAYCTKEDIKKNLPILIMTELTDDLAESDGENISSRMDAIITTIISSADAEIDDYCRGRYTIPFSPVPVTIKQISVDISIYRLYGRVRQLEAEHPKRLLYSDAIARLRRINSGELVLGTTPAVTAADMVNISTNKLSTDRVFTKTELGLY